MRRLFNVSILFLIMVAMSFVTAMLLLCDIAQADHFALLFLQPLSFGALTLFTYRYMYQIMSRISMVIIYLSYFCRMVLVPLFMFFGSYSTLLSESVIGPHMSEAIILSCIEWIIIAFMLIYNSAKQASANSLFENYRSGVELDDISDNRVPQRLKILIALMALYIIYIILQDDSVIRQNFSLMVGTSDDWYVRAGYRSLDDVGGEGVLGVMVTAVLYFFWYIQALVPPVLLIRIMKKGTSTKTKIFQVYLIAGIVFMITTGTKAHSVECALAFILLAYSIFGNRMRTSLKLIAYGAIVVVFVAIFAKSGLSNSAANISSVFSSYFGGVQNLSAAIYAKSTGSGFGVKNILADFVNQIPLFGNRLRTMLNLGSTTNRLFNAAISQRNIGQIIPSIGQGYSYFGLFFAPVIPMIATSIAIGFDNKAINETNLIKKNVYLIAAIMMARAVAMTNLMSAVIYLFNTYVSLGIVWFGGRMSARMKENKARNGNATIIESYK